MVGILKVIFQFVSHWIRDRDGLATVALRERQFHTDLTLGRPFLIQQQPLNLAKLLLLLLVLMCCCSC